MGIGELLKHVRTEKGLTQHDLAQKCGIHRNTIYRYENSDISPPVDALIKIAQALECDANIFLPEGSGFGGGSANGAGFSDGSGFGGGPPLRSTEEFRKGLSEKHKTKLLENYDAVEYNNKVHILNFSTIIREIEAETGLYSTDNLDSIIEMIKKEGDPNTQKN